jgi:hypothetical protein
MNLGRTTYSKLRIVFATLAVALVTVTPAVSAPDVPNLVGPDDAQTVSFLPVFSWDPVAGADKYNFVLAADDSFNSPVYQLNGTKNTRATPYNTVPNGTYYWRVQAVDVDGNTSGWSDARSIEKLWADSPALTAPADGATISFPDEPLVLRWDPVPGAAKYHIYISPNEDLTSLVSGNDPLETQATNAAPRLLLPSNTYYWSVIPLDAKDNEGEPSEIRSFTWEWPSATTPAVEDIAPETERYVPKFTWDPIPGAAKYEVEVNSVADFPPGPSKVCCSTTTDVPITTSFIPKETFPNNTYYWRVRALNAEGEAGQWNEGPSFTKVFDNYPLLDEDPIKNLRMRDAADPGTDIDLVEPGYQTQLPIVTWDPVPGASAYQVWVVPFTDGACNVTASSSVRWLVRTSTTSWTPLAWGPLASKPLPTGPSVSKDTPALVPGQAYCVQVRARSGRVSLSEDVWGDFTPLDDGTGASFTFDSFPTGSACSPSCLPAYLGNDDYLLPQRGEATTANPLFIWNPIADKASYWVIVAKDPSFTNIVDYALTRIPAYAVRTGSSPKTYPDETTSYYWLVFPAPSTNGGGAGGSVADSHYANFEKQADPPVLLGPDNDSVFSGPPTFSWEAAEGAKRYRFQVATESTFAASTLLDNITTAATEYTAQSTYQASKTLYWRVQAEDENDNDLTWSETRTFEIDLEQPALDPATPTLGDASLPVLRWFPVPGAVS